MKKESGDRRQETECFPFRDTAFSFLSPRQETGVP